MNFTNTHFVLTEEQLENNSSHIYLLNQTLKNCIDDFVEGFNLWEKSKAEIINKMAFTLEKLHFLGEYSDPLNTISTYIRKQLAARGVSDYNLDYVGRVLPSKYKNEELSRESNGRNIHADSSNNVTNHDKDDYQVPLVNAHNLMRKLTNMARTSKTEFQNFGIELEQQQKHIRNNMKTQKEVYEFVAINEKVPVARYKKVSSDVPPAHLTGKTIMSEKIKEMAATVADIHKYLLDIAQSVEDFPPEEQLAKDCAHKLDVFDKTVLKTIKLMLVPYSDKKYSGDWVKWCDINLTRLEQSKNYAGSKHALETGEFATKIGKDGKEVILSLDRGITREQVGDREPDIYIMARQVLLGNQAIDALHNWSYKTNIMEEYDENGNPIMNKNS